MLRLVQRLVCRHSWFWSERRQREICYDCGSSRRAADIRSAPLRQADDEAAAHPPRDNIEVAPFGVPPRNYLGKDDPFAHVPTEL